MPLLPVHPGRAADAANASSGLGITPEAIRVTERVTLSRDVAVRAARWLCQHSGEFTSAALTADPSEARITALSEVGWMLVQFRRCGTTFSTRFPGLRALEQTLVAALSGPWFASFCASAPVPALIALVILRLALPDEARERILPRRRLADTLVERHALHAKRSAMREIEWRYFLWLSGMEEVTDGFRALAGPHLAELEPQDFQSLDNVYELTHILFYVTDFGWKPTWTLDPDRLERVRGLVLDLLERMLVIGNWDLAAELIICHRGLNGSDGTEIRRAWRTLAQAQHADGAFSGGGDTGFFARYHPCLVVATAGILPRLRADLQEPFAIRP